MAKLSEEKEIAKYKYQTIKFFPFDVEPGASLVLTSDPWAFLRAWLEIKIKNSRGDNKSRLVKAKYFIEQSEGFQDAADKIKLPTKATLVYYSLLNLVKAFLCSKGLDLEIKQESHGFTLTEIDFEIKIYGKMSNCINIFQEFCKSLDRPIKGQTTIELNKVFSDIPEIHEIVFSLGQMPKRKYLPVEIDFISNVDHNKLFTEIKYKKENESRLPTEKFLKGHRLSYFKQIEDHKDGCAIFQSVKKKSYRTGSSSNLPVIYKNICKEYKNLELNTLLTREGYKFYVNLNTNPFHQLANVYLLIFYWGNVARYRPTVVDKIMTGELYTIMSESIETCPRQFLYHLTSLMTGNVCAVPKSKI